MGAVCSGTARHLAGRILGWIARVWLFSLRLSVHVDPALALDDPRPWILAFHHGKQWPLLAWRRRRATVVMVSLSRDGELQSGALRSLGLRVVRGSTSRMGVRALAAVIREVKRGGRDAAFAVDGPRGPRETVHGGAITTARAAGGVVIPLGSAMRSGLVLRRAWDLFELAWPRSRVAVVLGAPVSSLDTEAEGLLRDAIRRANQQAAALLSPGGAAPRVELGPDGCDERAERPA